MRSADLWSSPGRVRPRSCSHTPIPRAGRLATGGPFSFQEKIRPNRNPTTMITSPQNEKLKLVRRLRERRHRDREGLFVTEGEDLVDAGRAAGIEPAVLLTAAGIGPRRRGGGRRAACRGLGARVGDARYRGLAAALGRGDRAPLCLHARRRRPGQRRRDRPHRRGAARRDRRPRARLRRSRTARRRCGRAWARSSPSRSPAAPSSRRPSRGRRSSPTVARTPTRSRAARRSASAPSGRGSRPRSSTTAARRVTIPLRAGAAESLNVAAAAAIALERVASAASMSDSSQASEREI